MSAMRVLRGRGLEGLSREELVARAAGVRRVVVDLGTGDGRYAYERARAHPEELVIGVDALAEPQAESAARAARRPARGGAENVLFAVAPAESLPPELAGLADEIRVLLPWGSLMEAVATAEPTVLAGLVRIARPGARLVVTLNTGVWERNTPKQAADLPPVTPEHVDRVLAPLYAAAGIHLAPARLLTREECGATRSTWARRLAHPGRDPSFLRLEGTIAPAQTDAATR